MQRTGFAGDDCPVARALDAIGDWWSLLIVRDAFDGLRRFGDFQRNLGIAKGMLTARLRKLVELGVLEQVAASDGSAYQEYALTKKGHALFPVVVSLRQWGEANLFARGEPHSVLVDAQGERVGQLVLPSKAGRPLAWSETRVRKVAARKR
ncbi:helix-turn-helix domain-containing protein [Bradyrhizobium sp. CCBAU 51753]|uniref:winged helix-turn-helix transcriptional regulator n=1 Tax=Bradyrhizobium sp. CCBAU 51753 TaxID=1325100 RepID=UPI00188CF22B|nr:helix-turn-helix domain-containing protein [Bradyrhizobium sp. CCBAU 51753]QOZ29790.1 transcriptional regulator [Bradyrhizobium sp. CCBAU 51753]